VNANTVDIYPAAVPVMITDFVPAIPHFVPTIPLIALLTVSGISSAMELLVPAISITALDHPPAKLLISLEFKERKSGSTGIKISATEFQRFDVGIDELPLYVDSSFL